VTGSTYLVQPRSSVLLISQLRGVEP
jgi:hypothetical protein